MCIIGARFAMMVEYKKKKQTILINNNISIVIIFLTINCQNS